MEITADTVIAETLRMSPDTFMVYRSYNVRCPTCQCRATDTVRDVSRNYGVRLDALLRDLNAVLRQETASAPKA